MVILSAEAAVIKAAERQSGNAFSESNFQSDSDIFNHLTKETKTKESSFIGYSSLPFTKRSKKTRLWRMYGEHTEP